MEITGAEQKACSSTSFSKEQSQEHRKERKRKERKRKERHCCEHSHFIRICLHSMQKDIWQEVQLEQTQFPSQGQKPEVCEM